MRAAPSAHPAVLAELKRRQILRAEDTVVRDKGYYAYENYVLAVWGFCIILVISPKKGFDPAKMRRRMHYPLRIFSHHDHRKVQLVYKRVVRTLIQNLERWKEFVATRSLIDDLF